MENIWAVCKRRHAGCPRRLPPPPPNPHGRPQRTMPALSPEERQAGAGKRREEDHHLGGVDSHLAGSDDLGNGRHGDEGWRILCSGCRDGFHGYRGVLRDGEMCPRSIRERWLCSRVSHRGCNLSSSGNLGCSRTEQLGEIVVAVKCNFALQEGVHRQHRKGQGKNWQ